MKKSILIIIGLIIVLVGGIWIYSSSVKATGPRIKTFMVEKPDLAEPNFIATAFKLSRVDIFGISASSTKSKDDIKLGTMEMVESNAEGEQTWYLAVPETPASYKEVYAQGYVEAGGKANKVALKYKNTDEITAALWPGETKSSLTGTVKDVKTRSLTMGVSAPANAAMTVVYASDMKIIDSKGKPVSISKIHTGSVIHVLGVYKDEMTFTASEIELSGS